jgi:NADPH-ferrihemoprotein reductase
MSSSSSAGRSTLVVLGVAAGAAAVGAGISLFLYCRQKSHDYDGAPKSPTADSLNIRPSRIAASAFTKKATNATSSEVAGKQSTGGISEKAATARVHVVFGSATGTAEGYARALVQETQERNCPAALWDAEEFYQEYFSTALTPLQTSSSSSSSSVVPFEVVLFILATTGDGEPTDNFRKMYSSFTEAIKSASGENSNKTGEMAAYSAAGVFRQRFFAVFGLGDTSYKYYNKIAVDVDEWLGTKFASQRLVPIGLGDAKDPAQEDHFDTWKELVWDALDTQCSITLSEASRVPRPLENVFVLEDDQTGESTGAARLVYTAPPSHLEPSLKHPLMARVLQKRELLTRQPTVKAAGQHSIHDGGLSSDYSAAVPGIFGRSCPPFEESTILLEVSIEGSGIVYQGGDHCAIYPSNPKRIVDGYLDVLRVSPEDSEKLVKLCTRVNAKARASLQNTLPGHVSLRLALAHYLDLAGKVRKSTLRQLAKFCSDEHERRVFNALIQSLSSSAGLREPKTPFFNDGSEIPDPSNFRIVLDYLNYFKSCTVPLANFFELMPRMQPRYYSIASDQLTHKSSIQLIIKMERGGLTSEFLAHSVNVGDFIPIFVRKSSFHLPLNAKLRPIVMIGPGTGVAPLLGFCYRRRGWLLKNNALGEAVLFFGCRRRTEDDIAAEFTASFLSGGELSASFTAYSREQDDKVYVQHLIAQHAAQLADMLLKRDGAVYICGDASRMAKDVERALLDEVLVKAGGLSRHVAGAVLKRMEKSDRFLKDVW